MNVLAGAFLLPRNHLVGEAGTIRDEMTICDILNLKRIYLVSTSSMMMKLGQTGVIELPIIKVAFLTYARSWRTEEP